jgi:hypothetical protein
VDAEVGEAEEEEEDEAGALVVRAAASVCPPEDAEASTREIARKPRPTAAAAEAVQAEPRRRVRFMTQTFQPTGSRAG